ncbi:MAG: APC family permease [Firmicutes bacterium]|nr:APC family permease [Bacillota bacterium]
MSIKVIEEPAPKPGVLKKPELFALSIGQVIGAGVITLIVPAMKMTGYSAWLAYFIAVIFGFITLAPVVFVASTVRLGGGFYSLICDMAGPTVSGIYAFGYLAQTISLSLFGVAAAEYMSDTFPVFSGSFSKIVIGIFLLTLFYVVNLMGINIMATIQKYMTWLLIVALLMFTAFGIANIKLPIFEFTNPGFLANGWIQFTKGGLLEALKSESGLLKAGFIPAILLYVYSTQGYMMTIAYGRESQDATHDIPFAILMSVPALIVLYVGVAIAATGSFSIAEFGNSTSLTYAAKAIMPNFLFYVFIIAGPIMCLLSTLNSSFAFSAITIGQSCEDGWLPKKFGERNSRGARKYVLTFMYIIGVLPIIFQLRITTITNLIQLVVAALTFLYFVAYFKMPRKYPEAWNKSHLNIPNWIYYTIVVISLLANLIIFLKSIISISFILAMSLIVALAIAIAIGIWRSRTGDINIHTSVWVK